MTALAPWILLFGVAVILVEAAVAGVWTARLASRGRRLAAMLQREQALVREDVERLRATLEETRRLWEPWRRALRWIRHPLVVAVLASLRRRWAG